MSSAQPPDSDVPAQLPRRRAGSVPGGGARFADPAGRHWSGDLLTVVEEALRGVSGKDPNIYGMLVASADGLVLASDTHDIQRETVAAMAAAAASIAVQFTDQADVGESKASIFQGSSGYVGVYPVEPSVLLVVFGQKDMNMGLFNVAARNALSGLQQAMDRQRLFGVRMSRQTPTRTPADDISEDASADVR
ncbi:roadblock/LC7 domain-containing protein [Actinophytocola sp.]|uniref:roadblock/LC7 domain-containing protein n=1 Tax=Actinophytocola sp. TaxID=1872138 RepID=UPI002ED538D4